LGLILILLTKPAAGPFGYKKEKEMFSFQKYFLP